MKYAMPTHIYPARLRVLLGAAAAWSLVACTPELEQSVDAAPPEVVVHEVAQEDVRPYLEFPGQVMATDSISVIPRVEGRLLTRNFKSGDKVEPGDVVYEVDPEPFKLALAETEAALRDAQAELKEARANYQRAKQLIEKQTIAQMELDKYRAVYEKATADIKAREAAVAQARLNLDYATISAPVVGIISHDDRVSVGDLVGPGRGPIGRFDSQQLARIFFNLDEKTDIELYGRSLDGEVLVIEFRLRLANGDDYLVEEYDISWDNQVNPKTGTRLYKLAVANPDGILTPGMSVTVFMIDRSVERHIAVPQEAVQQDQLGHYLMVVRDDQSVEQRHVVLGQQVGSWWLIEEGVVPEERIVVKGLQRIRPGIEVAPVAE